MQDHLLPVGPILRVDENLATTERLFMKARAQPETVGILRF
jgi:hypothetical protein